MTVTVILLILYLFVIAAGYWLRSINLRHLRLHGVEVPPGFDGAIDAGILAMTTAYTLEQSRVGLVESVVDNILLLVFLFDTLFTQMNHREILAILAHEVGHWKKGHILKRLILTEAGGLVAFYLAFRILQWGGLPGLAGLTQASFPAQLVILAFLGSLVTFPFTPLFSWLSRRHEWQADRFACELSGAPDAFATALIKLSRENLANLHPHPFYAKFYYSHPPVVERVQRLREEAEKG